jgi:DNA polymerase-3 subunit delta
MKLGAGAARELALRIGGFVTDNDAERRNQTRMAALELDKLSLYRGTGPVSVDDVRALVAEAVPGSVWALTDAVGQRDAAKASALLDRLAPSTPEPVLLAVLHRRIRELLEVADLVAGGAREEALTKTLGLHSFRAQILTTQARRWTVAELQAALEDLLELDATVKGAPGSEAGDSQRRLGFTLWIADHVAPAAATRTRSNG